jgi:hypothetical protein
MKTGFKDIIFILISAAILVVLSEYGLLVKYHPFALIPVLIAYYAGKYVGKKS